MSSIDLLPFIVVVGIKLAVLLRATIAATGDVSLEG
jgi:hypothetical protein